MRTDVGNIDLNFVVEECKRVFCLPNNVSINFVDNFDMIPNAPSTADGATIGPNKDAPILVLVKKQFSSLLMLQTLCHEIVHVHQILHGRMTHSEDYSIFWFDHEMIMTDEVEYMDYPWEKEAFAWQNQYLRELLMNSPKLMTLVKNYLIDKNL